MSPFINCGWKGGGKGMGQPVFISKGEFMRSKMDGSEI